MSTGSDNVVNDLLTGGAVMDGPASQLDKVRTFLPLHCEVSHLVVERQDGGVGVPGYRLRHP